MPENEDEVEALSHSWSGDKQSNYFSDEWFVFLGFGKTAFPSILCHRF